MEEFTVVNFSGRKKERAREKRKLFVLSPLILLVTKEKFVIRFPTGLLPILFIKPSTLSGLEKKKEREKGNFLNIY